MKKLLLLTYYWPPAGGPGVHRVIKFVQYLPALGWQPVILTVDHGDFPARDESLTRKIPDTCHVVRTPILEPFGLYRKLTGRSRDEKIPTFVLNPRSDDTFRDRIAKRIRANLFVPDARIGWYPYAVKAGMRLIQEHGIDLIFSTSPPQTVQLIGKRLARRSGVKWVADFRDPWTEAFWVAEYQQRGLSGRLNRKMETGVLEAADAVVTVTSGMADLLAAKSDNRYEVIYNGFESLYPNARTAERFIILFFGYLNKYQMWESLPQAVGQLPEKLRNKIEIHFIGQIFEGFRARFDAYADLNITLHDYLPHNELMSFASQAALLFRPLGQTPYAHKAIGAKTFDYLALRKPILAIGPQDSLIGRVLKETQSGEIFAEDAIPDIAAFIERQWEIWHREKRISLPPGPHLEPYRTEVNVKKLVALFDELTGV